ncbi:MAG: HAD-IIIA family hydrolase [Candidatus Omnitrophica bacterium]|nr:HAD-IIIA family hydrolase [Candidatus Omnitrophota bacterium]
MRERVVFLDRDGVINRFPGIGNYVTRREDFRFLPRVREAVRLLNDAGFELKVLSNQGCVSHGLLTKKELEVITRKMLAGIEKKGGRIKGVHYCPHRTADHCRCKKPETGLFKKAVGWRKFDFSKTYFVGDSREDVEAGRRIGCRTLLVLSGRTKKKDLAVFQPKPDLVKKDLWEAAKWIIQEKS